MSFAWDDDVLEQASKLYTADNLSIRRIALILKTTPGTIIGKFHRHGIKRPFSPEMLARRNSAEAKVQRKQQRAVVPAPPQMKILPEPFLPPPQITQDVARKSFAALDTKVDCKWPVGDPREGEFGFCALPAVPGRPYCLDHCRRSHIQQGSPNDNRS